MKNILKKLGVFGLIVAIFSPFVELPIVNAETEAACEKHLHNYLFLDVAYPHEFKKVYVNNGGYTTYANFSYRFQETTNTEIKNLSVNWDYVEDDTKERQYWNLYTTVHSNALSSGNTNSLGSYYLDYTNQEVGGSVFVSSQSSQFDKNTILLHTQWARRDEWGNAITSEWTPKYNELTIQEVLGGEIVTGDAVVIDGATYSKYNFGSLTPSYAGKMPNYFNSVINGTSPANTKVSVGDESFLPLQITRKLDESSIQDKVYGYKYQDAYYVFDKTADGTNYDSAVDKVSGSYETYMDYLEKNSDNPMNASKNDYIRKVNDGSVIDFDVYEAYYWPFVLNVKFDECSYVADVPEEPEEPAVGNWGLSYNSNVEDPTEVTDTPKGQTEKVGTDIVISKDTPKRNGYTFDGWCETETACANPYKAGDTFKYRTEIGEKTIPLFAQWKQTGTEDNKKTGVVSYIIGFSAVALVAGGIYIVSKKKNLFKQI